MTLNPSFTVEPTERFRAGKLRTVATFLVVVTVGLAAGGLYATTFDKNTDRIGRIIMRTTSVPWYLSSTVVTFATFLEGVQGFVKPFLGTITLGRVILGWLDSAADVAMKLRADAPPRVLEATERRRKGYSSESATVRRLIRRLKWSARLLQSAPARIPWVGIVAVTLVIIGLGTAGGLLLLTATVFLFVRLGVV